MMFCIVQKWKNGSINVIGPMEEEQANEMVAKYFRGISTEIVLMTPRGLAIEAEEEHIERMAGTITEPDCC